MVSEDSRTLILFQANYAHKKWEHSIFFYNTVFAFEFTFLLLLLLSVLRMTFPAQDDKNDSTLLYECKFLMSFIKINLILLKLC